MAYEYQEYPKCWYHHMLAPAGKIFASADETQGLKRQGWVDTPAKFPPASRLATALRALKPWWLEWEWAVKGAAVVLGLLAALIALVKLLA